MATTSQQAASLDYADSRYHEMHSQLEAWAEELIDLVDEAAASEEIQGWLDVQSRFHDYSHRNSYLIKLQCPEATKVAGYRTWQEEFDRHVREDEQAIWIWAPIITKRCQSARTRPDTTRTPSASTTKRVRRSGPKPWSGSSRHPSSMSPRPRAKTTARPRYCGDGGRRRSRGCIPRSGGAPGSGGEGRSSGGIAPR